MVHLLIVLYGVAFTAGALSFLYSNQIKSVCSDIFLSPYRNFILSLCALTALKLLNIYFFVNVLSSSGMISKYVGTARHLLDFAVLSAVIFFFCLSVWRLIKTPPSRLFKNIFFISFAVFIFIYGAVTGRFFSNGDYQLFRSIDLIFMFWIAAAAVWILIVLIRTMPELKKAGLEKPAFEFVLFYLPAYLFLLAGVRTGLPKTAATLFNIMVLLSFNIYPLIWLKRYFRFISRNKQEAAIDHNFMPTISAQFGLSKRESEILGLISKGYTNKEITRALFISHGTVRNNVSSLYQKVGVKNRIKLAGFVNVWRKERLEKDDVPDF